MMIGDILSLLCGGNGMRISFTVGIGIFAIVPIVGFHLEYTVFMKQ